MGKFCRRRHHCFTHFPAPNILEFEHPDECLLKVAPERGVEQWTENAQMRRAVRYPHYQRKLTRTTRFSPTPMLTSPRLGQPRGLMSDTPVSFGSAQGRNVPPRSIIGKWCLVYLSRLIIPQNIAGSRNCFTLLIGWQQVFSI